MGRFQLKIEDNKKRMELILRKKDHHWHYHFLNKCKVNQTNTFLENGSLSSIIQDQIIGNPSSRIRTRSFLRNICNNLTFISQIEPKNINDALHDENWMIVMQEELNQSERSEV